MNLNPHARAAVTDGLFAPADPDDPDSPLLFVPLPPPTDFDIEVLLRAACRRVLSIARRFHVSALTLHALERELGMRPRPGDKGTDESLDDARDCDDWTDDFADHVPDYELDPEQDPQQALLEQTLANALRPPLTPAPSPAQGHLTSDDLSLLEPQTSLPALKSLGDELPPPLCARRAGLSLHAARTVDKDDRHGPGRLCK